MRKTTFLLMVLLLMTVFALPAGAVRLENTDAYWTPGVHTDGINNDAEDQADMLKALGLFRGTDKGYELDRSMTRAETAAMLVRFLGTENEALNGAGRHPFNDVPAWADKYVGWLYQNGLTKGMSAVKFGAQEEVTLKQYALFMSRALIGPGISDNDWTYVATTDEIKLWDEDNKMFTRAMAVGISTRALSLTYSADGENISMAQRLVNQGAFTAEQLRDAAWGVLPSEYIMIGKNGADYLARRTAGVLVAISGEPGYTFVVGCANSTLDYLPVWRKSADGANVDFSLLGPKTMELIKSGSTRFPDWQGADYLGTVDGRDYLSVKSAYGENGSLRAGALVCWDGQAVVPVLSARELWGDTASPFAYEDAEAGVSILTDANGGRCSFFDGENLLIAGKDAFYYFTLDKQFKSRYPAGTQFLAMSDGTVVGQLVTDEKTVISCIDAKTGKALDEYTVLPDMEGEEGRRTVTRQEGNYFFGEAGLYKYEGGRLYQLTERPSLVVTAVRWGAGISPPIILTHAPGERVYGMTGPGGNSIVMINEDGRETVMLSSNPPHGINITSIGSLDSSLRFYSEEGVGMGHANVYTYALLSNQAGPEIIVMDYEAGRPETEAGWSPENLDGYKHNYIVKEQMRLDALGY